MATFSSNGVTVEFDDNSPEVLAALENAVIRALEACCMLAEDYAREKCPVGDGPNAGNLKNHITSQVDEEEQAAYIGVSTMNPPYGIYVEFGTGVFAEQGNGRKTPWCYKADDGNFYFTNGQEPQPFIRPAAEEHVDEYRQIMIDSLENA